MNKIKQIWKFINTWKTSTSFDSFFLFLGMLFVFVLCFLNYTSFTMLCHDKAVQSKVGDIITCFIWFTILYGQLNRVNQNELDKIDHRYDLQAKIMKEREDNERQG